MFKSVAVLLVLGLALVAWAAPPERPLQTFEEGRNFPDLDGLGAVGPCDASSDDPACQGNGNRNPDIFDAKTTPGGPLKYTPKP